MEDSLRYGSAWPFQDVEDYYTKIETPHRYSDTRPDGELWLADRQQYFDHLTVLSRLEPSGAAFAIEKASVCAMKEFDGYWPDRDNDHLRDLDYFTLEIVCREVRRHRSLGLDDDKLPFGCARGSYVGLINDCPKEMASWSIEYLMEVVQGKCRSTNPIPDAQMEELKQLLRDETDHQAVVRRIWFPLTLQYLREIQRKRITDFLVPRIAGHILPVELQDAIAGFVYDADFVQQAPIIAKENAPATRPTGDE